MEDILEFSGENRWLSNFTPCKVELDSVTYPSVEHAYQAAKSPIHARSEYLTCTAGNAKKLGSVKELPENWDTQKLEVMKHLLKQKFTLETELGQKLLATYPVQIIEGNAWKDRFWGVYQGCGLNLLGKMIMEIREELYQNQLNVNKNSEISLSN